MTVNSLIPTDDVEVRKEKKQRGVLGCPPYIAEEKIICGAALCGAEPGGLNPRNFY